MWERTKKTFEKYIFALTVLLLSGCAYESHISSRTVSFEGYQHNILKVMTFNIRVNTMMDGFNCWSNRKNIVFDTITANTADVFGLQEAKHNQSQQIQRALPQYDTYEAGRSDGKTKGESCAIFYRKDRFYLIRSGTFWFSDTPNKPGSKDWGNIFPRICSWVYLVEKNSKTGFYVYNVHLDNLSQNSRKKSVMLLSRRIAERKTQEPFILMGDFNMEQDNPAMAGLQKIYSRDFLTDTIDVWTKIYPNQTHIGTRHGFSGEINGPRIDHILVSENTQALNAVTDQFNRDGRYPSDHFPVIATIRLNYQALARQNFQSNQSVINRNTYSDSDMEFSDSF